MQKPSETAFASSSFVSFRYAEGLGAIQYAAGGEVGGYAEVHHTITFAPLRAGYARESVGVRFAGYEETLDLSILGSSIEVPVYVAEPVMDLRCCVYGKLYRKKILLKNRGKIAFKAIAKVPKKFKEWFEYQPDMGFVQPGEAFEMSIKFRPSEGLVPACAPYCILDKGIIALPLRIHVPDQALPVYYTLRARLTRGDVRFSSPSFDFGPCYVNEARSAPLVLTNESLLPQKFGFVHLPAELDVQPNDGFGILMPKASITVDVIFKPSSSVMSDVILQMRTSMNMSYAVKCRGHGVEPPLKFPHSIARLAPCQPGDRQVASIFVSHPAAAATSRAPPRTFELFVPRRHQSFLKIEPSVATVNPGETRRLEITFAPPRSKGPRAPELRDAKDVRPEPDVRAILGLPPPPPVEDEVVEEDDFEELPEGAPTDEELREKADAGDADASTELDRRQAIASKNAEKAAAAEAERLKLIAPPEPWEGVFEISRHRFSDLPGYDPQCPKEDLEPWSEHATWKVPVFIKPHPTEKEPPTPMMLEVQTTTVERTLWCDAERVDFGQLAVGQTKTLPLRVRGPSGKSRASVPSEYPRPRSRLLGICTSPATASPRAASSPAAASRNIHVPGRGLAATRLRLTTSTE